MRFVCGAVILVLLLSVSLAKECSEKDNDCLGCLTWMGTGPGSCGYCKSTNKCLVGTIEVDTEGTGNPATYTYYPNPTTDCPQVYDNWVWWNDGIKRGGNDKCPVTVVTTSSTTSTIFTCQSFQGGSCEENCCPDGRIGYLGSYGCAISKWCCRLSNCPATSTSTTSTTSSTTTSSTIDGTTTSLTTTTLPNCRVGSCCGCHTKYNQDCECDMSTTSCSQSCQNAVCGGHNIQVPPTGKYFYVNQDNLIMCCYDNGVKRHEFLVTTGADGESFTEAFDYQPLVQYLKENGFYYSKYNCYADNVWQWSGDYLIHSPPYVIGNGNSKIYLGTYNGWQAEEMLGKCRSTHGCTRLSAQDIITFTNWVREAGDITKVVGSASANPPSSPDCYKTCPPMCKYPCPTTTNSEGKLICTSTPDCKPICTNLVFAAAASVPSSMQSGSSFTSSFSDCSLGIAAVEEGGDVTVKLITSTDSITLTPTEKGKIVTHLICFNPSSNIRKTTMVT